MLQSILKRSSTERGGGTYSWRSNLPGLNNAASILSGRLVAATTTIPCPYYII